MSTPFLEAAIGAIVWALANVVYIGLRRRGERSIGRVLAFLAGQPTTWISFFAVPEGGAPRIEPPPDDVDRLLREIRIDRELRGRPSPPGLGPDRGDGQGAPPEN